MFWYFPFFIFAGAMIYAFPNVGFWIAGAYVAALIWPRMWHNPRNGPRFY